MSKFSLISLFICLLFSCNKSSDVIEIKCPNGMAKLEPVACSQNLCQSDTCLTYMEIWKELFLERNHMSQDYFENHITLCNSRIERSNDKITFRINYKIKIDWAEDLLYDQFVIWLAPSTTGLYPSIIVPRNVLLTKDQIDATVNIMAFSSGMNKVNSIDQLKYPAYQDALNHLILAAGVDKFCGSDVFFMRPHMVDIPNGNPFLSANGELAREENRCIMAEIDLVTGEYNIHDNPCVIYFCFKGSTQITLNNGMSVPIEKIKINDTILSVNIKTMEVQSDIVRQIDVANHDDIVELRFSDGTLNYNTFDHPYLIEGKGWCSYDPAETHQKYKIEAKQIQIGDNCFKYMNNRLEMIQVTGITVKPGEIKTYNLSLLENNKNYFANQILVSNEDF